VYDFNTALSALGRSFRPKKKKNKEILKLNYTIDQMDLTYIYIVFHPTAPEFTFSSAAHMTFSKIDNILGYKASLNKFKKIKITWYFIRSQWIKTRSQQEKLQKID
jgi:hypothetical protein